LADISSPVPAAEAVVSGTGTPITLFAHGFAGSIAETRPFGSGVHGTRIFFHFGGHGSSPPSTRPWSYAGLASEAAMIRRMYNATRGVGVSMGAGALLSAALAEPESFERLVLILPPTLDAPRSGRAVEQVEQMALRAEAGDVETLTALLLAEQPARLRGSRIVAAWARAQAGRMSKAPLVDVIRDVPQQFPVADRLQLSTIGCPVLVLGQEADEAHPAALVDELVEALPDARGRVFGPGGLQWGNRAELRAEIGDFLNAR
jgi:pimeloyl-ACP methyl ester carboxylesterase